jgi:excisionase family DNA binding protein
MDVIESQTIQSTPIEAMLLTAEEAAKRLSFSRATVYAMIASGELPMLRKGRAVRVPLRALERWIDEHTCEGRAVKSRL